MKCDYAARSIFSLKKHKRNEHVLSFEASLSLREHPQSTRNNSLIEKMMLEDMSSNELTTSLNLDEKAMKYTCLECKLFTSNKVDMDTHVRDQHLPNEDEVVKFTCTKCGHDFDEVENYSSHMNSHDNEKKQCSKPPNKKSKNTSDILVELTCRKCPFECESKDEMDKHYVAMHETCKRKKCEEFTFKCHLCDYGSNETRNIDAHGLIEHGILKCERCDYRAEDRDIMRKHMETHSGQYILPCGICEFETTKKATLDELLNPNTARTGKLI